MMKIKLILCVLFGVLSLNAQIIGGTAKLGGTATVRRASSTVCTPRSGYSFCREITVQTSQITGTVTNQTFVIAFNDATFKTVANGGHVQNTSNSTCGGNATLAACPDDFVFTSDSAGTTLINWRWSDYSATGGTGHAWVLCASCANGTVIYTSYGNSGVSTFQGGTNASVHSNYKMMWDMEDNAADTVIADATSNTRTGTSAASNTSAMTSAGKVGQGFTFNGSTDYITSANITLANSDPYTYGCWAQISTTAVFPQIMTIGNATTSTNESRFGNVNTTPNAVINNSVSFASAAGNIGTATWAWIVMTYDATNGELYVNGATQAGPTAASYTGATGALSVADRFDGSGTNLTGLLDQCFYYAAKMSANEIAANYNNQNAPTSFWSIGVER